MRTKLGYALMFVGALLLFLGLAAQFYATDRLERTPIDTDVKTRLAGTAQTGGDDAEFPINVVSTTRVDSDASDDDVVVYRTSSCVVRDEGDVPECVSSDDPQDRLISASTDDFAADRESAYAVNDPRYLPASATPHEGLINKFPFDSQKKTYQYWNGTVGDTIDMVYERTEDLEGLEVYVYRGVVEDFPIEITEDIDGTFSSETEVFVEPITGAIVNQVGFQERLTTEGDLVLRLSAQFTDDQVETSVEDAKANKRNLWLVTSVVPIVGYAAGIPLLLLGLALLLIDRRSRPKVAGEPSPDRQPVAAGA